MAEIVCLDPNTQELTLFLNNTDPSEPLYVFLETCPIINTSGVKKINLTILINYMNCEYAYEFSIQYPSHLSIINDGQVLKEDIIWLKTDVFDTECALNQIIYSFPKLLLAKNLFYEFLITIKDSLLGHE